MHVLGASTAGRDSVADGGPARSSRSARSSVARQRTVPLSVVLPLRDRARRAADGSLNGPTRWVQRSPAPTAASPGWRTSAASAGAAPVTWLVDPAVLDALRTSAAATRRSSLGSERQPGRRRRPARDVPTAAPRRARQPERPVTGAPERRRSAPAPTTRAGDVPADHPRRPHARPGVRRPRRRRAGPPAAPPCCAGPTTSRTRSMTGAQPRPARPWWRRPAATSTPPARPHPRSTLCVLSDHGDPRPGPVAGSPDGPATLVLTDERAVPAARRPNSPTPPSPLRQRILAEAALEAPGRRAGRRSCSLPRRLEPGPDWRDADSSAACRCRGSSWSTDPARGDHGRTTASCPTDRLPSSRERGRVPSNIAATRG